MRILYLQRRLRRLRSFPKRKEKSQERYPRHRKENTSGRHVPHLVGAQQIKSHDVCFVHVASRSHGDCFRLGGLLSEGDWAGNEGVKGWQVWEESGLRLGEGRAS